MKRYLPMVMLCGLFFTGSVAADNALEEQPEVPAPPAGQQIYQSMQDGVPTFTDNSLEGGEAMDVKPTNTLKLAPSQQPTFVLPKEPLSRDYSMTILTPNNEQHYHNDPDPVLIRPSYSPALLSGHRLSVTDNGTEVQRVDGKYLLELPERGAHVLKARIVDEEGQIQGESEPVTIHVHRASRLLRPK